MVREVPYLVNHGRRMEQRLARDTADVKTHPSKRIVTFDQHGLHAEIGGAEGGRVAAGTGAQHQHVAFDIRFAGIGRREWRG